MIGTKAPVFAAILASHVLFLAMVMVTARAAPSSFSRSSNDVEGSQLKNDSNHPMTLVHLGVVDGKSYFVDVNVTLNWMEAKAYCEASNLKLASLESQAQLEFVLVKLQQFPVDVFYWTSLHESRRPPMMEWDGTNIAADGNILKNWRWDTPPYQYCTMFRVGPNNSYVMVLDGNRCGYKTYVLCQT